jgi:transcriptional regulator with XRE-family HTH domain
MQEPDRSPVEPIYRKLGKLIAERRNELNVSQEDLAKKLHMSRPGLANIEAGRQRIPLHRMLVIERELGYPAAYMILKVFKHGKPRIGRAKRTVQGLSHPNN